MNDLEYRTQAYRGIIIKRNKKTQNLSKENICYTQPPEEQIDSHIFHHRNNNCQTHKHKPQPSIIKQTSKFTTQIEHSCEGLTRVILDQNSNLKDQNNYLRNQLSKFKNKQKELTQTIAQYQSIMSVLNSQNERLHKQILYFSNNANSKMVKLKNKLNLFFKDKNKVEQNHTHSEYYEDDEQYTVAPSEEEYEQEEYVMRRNGSQHRGKYPQRFNRRQSMSKCASLQVNSYGQQCPFQILLQECRREGNPHKRKQMRRRLMEITSKRFNDY